MNENKNQNKNYNVNAKDRLFGETESTDTEKVLCEEELREIYRNATAGKDSVNILLPMSEDRNFRDALLNQGKKYDEFISRIEEYADENDADLKAVSPFAKGMMQMSATFDTITDKSPSKLASIMLEGINMGEISIIKIVNKLNKCGKKCPLASDMLDFLKDSAEEMKKYL